MVRMFFFVFLSLMLMLMLIDLYQRKSIGQTYLTPFLLKKFRVN